MFVLSGFSGVKEAIKADFKERLPKFHKSRCEGLTLLSSIMLDVRSANLMELSSALPRDIGTNDHRYQYVSRILSNTHIDCSEVMQAYAGDVFARLASNGQTIVLMIDQSHINDGHEVLMVSVRMRDRALPVAWRVRKTKGNIGYPIQKELLDSIENWVPEGADVLLTADRFYGTEKVVHWCQKARWGYRIRLKGNLTLQHQGGELSCAEIIDLMPQGLINAELYGSGVRTNIGDLHEAGHPEPWIIAMDAKPSRYTVLDYGMRWGIEAMFSDFKTRGFGIAQSQIKKPDRLERLILIMAIAMYWAVSTGAADEQIVAKNGKKRGVRKTQRSLCSLFKQGLRFLRRCFIGYQKVPKLWHVWIFEGW